MMTNTTRVGTVRINHDKYIELQLQELSHQAIDDLIAHIIDIIYENPSYTTIRLFINSGDLNNGQLIQYFISKVAVHRHDFRVAFKLRVAANFNLMPTARIAEMFIRTLYSYKVEFKGFLLSDLSGAMDWLLADTSG